MMRKNAKREGQLTARTAIRCSEDEKQAWEAASDAAGQSFSAWAAKQLNRASKPPHSAD